MCCCGCGDLFLALIAILFPPIAVWVKSGLCTADSLINIALCCLGYVPGLLHAWYIIARNPEYPDGYEPIRDSERGGERVTYYYINHRPDGQQQQHRPQPPNNYGATRGSNKPVPPPPVPPPASRPAGGSGGGGSAAAAGPSSSSASPVDESEPPSYADVVKGDNKIQTQD